MILQPQLASFPSNSSANKSIPGPRHDILNDIFPDALSDPFNQTPEESSDHLRCEPGCRLEHSARLGWFPDAAVLEAVEYDLGTYRMEMVVTDRATVYPPWPPPLALPTLKASVAAAR